MAPRRKAQERLPELVDAALRVFTREGYRAAQMADIANEMSMTEAALYRYVTGKEALFDLAIRHALLLEPLPADGLPLGSPPLSVTIKEIQATVHGAIPPPALAQALRRRRTPDPATELISVVTELFALETLTRAAADMVERSARELPELAELLHYELRRPLVRALTDYLEKRAGTGLLRRTPDANATARMALELITWFARHRFSDPDGQSIPPDIAEATVVDTIVHALVPSEHRP
ncbi:MAG TPA: helix-turn-helix domain-containing protein [Acidimicrobiales bacterium]|nr:helix-turn-helix domain-containing protein [Acidimicrobiales bacterium]